MTTPFIIVCPDTYEFFYPSMLYSNREQEFMSDEIRDISLAIQGNTTLPLKALGLLTASPKVADQNGGPIDEPVSGVVGRWFNKRIAFLTQGQLFNKLRDMAEGQIAEAKLAAIIAPSTEGVDSEDFLIEGILDSLGDTDMVALMAEDVDAEEETVEDKEEFISKEAEYSNISGLLRNYLVKSKIARDDDEVGETEEVEVVISTTTCCSEPIKAIKAIRAATDLGLAEAKMAYDAAKAAPVTLKMLRTTADVFKSDADAIGMGCEIKVAVSHPATIRAEEPVMKTAEKKAKARGDKTKNPEDEADTLAEIIAEATAS
jgi:ribosomal protein L7/L12